MSRRSLVDARIDPKDKSRCRHSKPALSAAQRHARLERQRGFRALGGVPDDAAMLFWHTDEFLPLLLTTSAPGRVGSGIKPLRRCFVGTAGENAGDLIIGGRKPLHLPWRLGALHDPLFESIFSAPRAFSRPEHFPTAWGHRVRENASATKLMGAGSVSQHERKPLQQHGTCSRS